ARHARPAVRRAGAHALEEPEHRAHARRAVERRDERHLGRAGVREADLDTAGERGADQEVRAGGAGCGSGGGHAARSLRAAAQPAMLPNRPRRSRAMAEVHVNEPIAAPAARVWELVRDFGGVAQWGGPALQSCTVEGAGVGAVRRIGLPGGLAIAERLEALDDAGRTLSYA